ncbi:ribonuclease P family protein [Forsythia ovata]|uniref:Ribonuclease P family protein n=1 Tax=Forsythia ovata TaxID=205694 RepID=A0ABD1WYN7_9LAMI
MDDQRKRTLEALERRFAQAEADLHIKQQKSKKRPIEDTRKATSSIESISADTVFKKPCYSTSSRKGNISFRGHTTAQDVKVNEPAYLELSYPVHENLLPTGVKISDRKTAVDRILHQLFQHGDSAQKYMQGSKSMKIDNSILLDNFVPKNGSSRTRIQALQSRSKRSKKHMSLKQHKKCGSFDLPHEFRQFETFKPMHDKWKSYIQQLLKIVGENQLAQCLLNADLHGALILVVQCKIVSYEGMCGIMVRETKETFGIITQDNKFRVVPKKLSVFMFQADCWKVTLHGDKLTSRNLVP